jgi:ABC-type uncharacterized transport system substrate-binding protein
MGFADPVVEGFVASLARPGKNLTGISEQSIDTAGKRLELAMDIVPSLKRAAVLLDPGDKRTVGITAFQALAAKQGIKTRAFPLLHADTFEAVLNGVARYQPAILFIERSPMTLMLRDSICQFATAHAIPVIGEGIVMAKAGALISYGADELETTRRLAVYVDKILKGANPGDLPIEQPTKFELVVNLKNREGLWHHHSRVNIAKSRRGD